MAPRQAPWVEFSVCGNVSLEGGYCERHPERSDGPRDFDDRLSIRLETGKHPCWMDLETLATEDLDIPERMLPYFIVSVFDGPATRCHLPQAWVKEGWLLDQTSCRVFLPRGCSRRCDVACGMGNGLSSRGCRKSGR